MPGSALPIEPQRDSARARKIHSPAPASNGAGPAAEPRADAPLVRLDHLDTLWFQVTGTICNLRCVHCFISCAPDNDSFEFLSLAEVEDWLGRSEKWGVKEYYFTGGEPFMNSEMEGILEDTLQFGPATVLTNATLFTARRVEELRELGAKSPHRLELRVSIDGPSPEINDPIRGEGTFARAMAGVGEVVAAGFRPIITAMQSWPSEQMPCVLQAFRDALGAVGYENPRLKILPPLLIGEEAERSRGYTPCERVTHEMLHGYDLSQLLCTSARLVTARGVYACPILLDYPGARLADTLTEAVGIDAPLGEAACYTCYTNGAICSNATTGVGQAAKCGGS